MLISNKVIDANNEQIGNEFGASLQYVAIAAHFAADALPQLSQHFFRQAEEENEHAMRFIKYVVDGGGGDQAFTRPGSEGHASDQCAGGIGAVGERLHHD